MSAKLRILFVDDDPLVLHGIVRSIRSMSEDWEVHTATNGDAALRILASEPFDVLITDLRMPGLDGCDLAQEVMMRYPWMARIMLTGMIDQPSRDRGSEWTDRVLSKPCPPEVLCSEIRSAIDRRAGDRELAVQRPKLATPLVLMVENRSTDVGILRQAIVSSQSSVDLLVVSGFDAAWLILAPAAVDDDARSARPDLLLIANDPADATCYEFLARYRASVQPKIPVIVISPSMRAVDVDAAIRTGAATVVSKPWSRDRYEGLARTCATYARLSAGTRVAPGVATVVPSERDR